MKNTFGKGIVVILSVMLAIYFIPPAFAQEEGPSAELSVSLLSAYIWRGQELSKSSIVVEPSMTVSYKGFSVNMWGNQDTDPYATTNDDMKSNWNETDFTLSYGRQFGILSAELGWIYYGLDNADDTQELYLSLGADVLLSPTLTIYRDFASAPQTLCLAWDISRL